jgi:lipopolysaccharide transport protein LptA
MVGLKGSMRLLKFVLFVLGFAWMSSKSLRADLDDPDVLEEILGNQNPGPDRPRNSSPENLGSPPAGRPAAVENSTHSPTRLPVDPVESGAGSELSNLSDPAPATPSTSSSTPRSQGRDPIHWVASSLRVDQKTRRLYLKGNVIVTQGTLRLEADEAVIRFDSRDEVNEIFASGNVRMRKDSYNPDEIVDATGDEAIFYNREQKIELKGYAGSSSAEARQAVIRRGASMRSRENQLASKKITYYIKSGWFHADRVEGTIQPITEGSE